MFYKYQCGFNNFFFLLIIFEADRAFRKLGNQLLTRQERFNSLAFLLAENKQASKINFDDIVHDFDKKKKNNTRKI